MIAQPEPIAQPHRPVRGQSPARRLDRIRQLVLRMRERGTPRPRRAAPSAPAALAPRRQRHHKRRAALVLSAGAMGFGSAAMGFAEREPSTATLIDSPETRQPARYLSASGSFREALIEEEGVRLTVYLDAAGLPTVGVGHLVTPADDLNVGEVINHDRVLDLFERDLRAAEQAVVRLAGDLPLFQHEFDALVDLVYNVGEGGVSVGESPRLNAAIAAGNYPAIAAELAYYHAGGSAVSGLVFRSERRTNMFAHATYADPRETAGASGLAAV